MTINKHASHIIYFQILYVMFSGLLIEFGLPVGIRYLTDAINLILFFAVLVQKDKRPIVKDKMPVLMMVTWYSFMIISACVRDFSVLRIAWASRNWARFFLFFVACRIFLHKKEVESLCRCLFRIYLLDFALICFQFIVLGHKGDDLGGIFGSMMGGNGQTNILLCIVLILGLCVCFEQKIHIRGLGGIFLLLASTMIIAALEELKVFYYEYIGIVVLVSVICRVKKKTDRRGTLWVAVAAVLSWLIGLAILAAVFPSHFKVIIGKTSYMAYEAHSSSQYKISRIKFIPEINELFFKGSPILNLTGYGFGNCEYSKFGFLTSPFYYENWETNYLYFSHQTLFLEGGLIGLGLFLAIFGVMAAQHLKKLAVRKTVNKYAVLGFVFGLVTMANVFYNNATRTEISYLTYFCLAAAYIMTDEGRDGVPCGQPT